MRRLSWSVNFSLLSSAAISILLAWPSCAQETAPIHKDGRDSSIEAATEHAFSLSIDDLFRIYANKTWVWKDGGAYFKSSGRRFVAVTRKESGLTSYAEGVWILMDGGRMCMRGRWIGTGGSADDFTCFEHKTANGLVYQRETPDGKWYVFSRWPALGGHEYSKFDPGDQISSQLERVKAYVKSNPPPRYRRKTGKGVPDLQLDPLQPNERMVRSICSSPWLLIKPSYCD